MSEISQTERVPDEELDQMIWKLERDGMTPKQLSLMRELREVRRGYLMQFTKEQRDILIKTAEYMANRKNTSDYSENIRKVAEIALAVLQSSGNSEQLEPVSNRDELPAKCWCQTCRPVTMNDMRFVVCPECGNKRCPRANDHRNACTGSNAPGQDGSAYPAVPKEVG